MGEWQPGAPPQQAERLRALHRPGNPLVLPNAWDAASARAVQEAGFGAVATTSAVIELRQYTLHPNRRDELIDLFEQHFIDGQEANGIRVLGQFRDADDPNRERVAVDQVEVARRELGEREQHREPCGGGEEP